MNNLNEIIGLFTDGSLMYHPVKRKRMQYTEFSTPSLCDFSFSNHLLQIISTWEETPSYFHKLDIRSLLQDDSIDDVGDATPYIFFTHVPFSLFSSLVAHSFWQLAGPFVNKILVILLIGLLASKLVI